MDDFVEKIEDSLEKMGLRDNDLPLTLFKFSGDNPCEMSIPVLLT